MMRGHCLCRDVAWEYEGDPNWNALCHCDSCRRSAGAPVVACIGVPRHAFRWTGKKPIAYPSSPGRNRLFCGRCGSSMAFVGDDFPDEIFLYAASLEDPTAYRPTQHTHFAERLDWLGLSDDLPKTANSERDEPA